MMKAGKYWIGDLCYVMHDVWDAVCDATSNGGGVLEGEFKVADKVFALYSTKYGDGEYCDDHGIRYSVDSGTLGCINIDNITDPKADLTLGNIVEFTRNFRTCNSNDGTINFGHVQIFTGDDYEEEEEWEEDYDEEEEEEES